MATTRSSFNNERSMNGTDNPHIKLTVKHTQYPWDFTQNHILDPSEFEDENKWQQLSYADKFNTFNFSNEIIDKWQDLCKWFYSRLSSEQLPQMLAPTKNICDKNGFHSEFQQFIRQYINALYSLQRQLYHEIKEINKTHKVNTTALLKLHSKYRKQLLIHMNKVAPQGNQVKFGLDGSESFNKLSANYNIYDQTTGIRDIHYSPSRDPLMVPILTEREEKSDQQISTKQINNTITRSIMANGALINPKISKNPPIPTSPHTTAPNNQTKKEPKPTSPLEIQPTNTAINETTETSPPTTPTRESIETFLHQLRNQLTTGMVNLNWAKNSIFNNKNSNSNNRMHTINNDEDNNKLNFSDITTNTMDREATDAKEQWQQQFEKYQEIMQNRMDLMQQQLQTVVKATNSQNEVAPAQSPRPIIPPLPTTTNTEEQWQMKEKWKEEWKDLKGFKVKINDIKDRAAAHNWINTLNLWLTGRKANGWGKSKEEQVLRGIWDNNCFEGAAAIAINKKRIKSEIQTIDELLEVINDIWQMSGWHRDVAREVEHWSPPHETPINRYIDEFEDKLNEYAMASKLAYGKDKTNVIWSEERKTQIVLQALPKTTQDDITRWEEAIATHLMITENKTVLEAQREAEIDTLKELRKVLHALSVRSVRNEIYSKKGTIDDPTFTGTQMNIIKGRGSYGGKPGKPHPLNPNYRGKNFDPNYKRNHNNNNNASQYGNQINQNQQKHKYWNEQQVTREVNGKIYKCAWFKPYYCRNCKKFGHSQRTCKNMHKYWKNRMELYASRQHEFPHVQMNNFGPIQTTAPTNTSTNEPNATKPPILSWDINNETTNNKTQATGEPTLDINELLSQSIKSGSNQ